MLKRPNISCFTHARRHCATHLRTVIRDFVLVVEICISLFFLPPPPPPPLLLLLVNSHYVSSHPGQLSLAIPPWVGGMSTGDGYDHCYGRKRRVLRSSSPCDQDCWYADPVVKIEPAIRLTRSYTGFIGFNPRRLKASKGDELPHNGPCSCEIFSSSPLFHHY